MNNSNVTRLVILVIIIAVGAYFFYGKPHTVPQGRILSSIEEKIMVPEGQTPRVVTLSNVDNLKQQPFFAKAQTGDSVAVYTDTVVLYRPSIDKVIAMGSIDPTVSAQLLANGGQPATGAAPVAQSDSSTAVVAGPNSSTTPVQAAGDASNPAVAPASSATASAPAAAPVTKGPVALEIRNGTAGKGLAKKFADMFNGDKNISGITTGNAANKDYKTTTIINLSGADIHDVETAFGAKTSGTTLPAGEATSKAGVVVIIGSDKL